MTPLHMAAGFPNFFLDHVVACVATLLQHGADGSATDHCGKTPIDYATERLLEVAAAAPFTEVVAGVPVVSFRNAALRTIMPPAQQAAALQHRLQVLRLLWWHRRLPALAAFVRARTPHAAASSAQGSVTAVEALVAHKRIICARARRRRTGSCAVRPACRTPAAHADRHSAAAC